MSNGAVAAGSRFSRTPPWNEGRLLGAKRALKQQQVWAIRFWLDQHRRLRDRALFDFAIDSKLRGCDVVKVRIGDIVSGGRVRDRAIVVQQKTKRPVQFELMEAARKTMRAWLERRGGLMRSPRSGQPPEDTKHLPRQPQSHGHEDPPTMPWSCMPDLPCRHAA